MKEFAQRPDFSIIFDGMHGAGGPFARRILVEELGFPEVRLRVAYLFVVCTALNIPFMTCNIFDRLL
jgi:phosphomannomutase